MTTVATLSGPARPVVCEKCGETLVAPDWAEYFREEHVILNLWSCDRCGSRFETEVAVPEEIGPEAEKEVLKEFWPSLLVA